MTEGLISWVSQGLEFLTLGGPVVGLLLVLSVVSVAIIILKYWQFFWAGVGNHAVLRQALRAWNAGHRDAALSLLSKSPTLSAGLTWQAMTALSMSKPGEQSIVEEKLAAEASGQLLRLRRGFRALDAIAQVAPLLGLFGTVLGMIEAFQQLQAAGNNVDPSLLAGGIWVALLTTAVGLAVAMPTSLFLTHLESRIARETAIIEYALTSVLNPVRLAASPAETRAAGQGRQVETFKGQPSNATT